MNRFKQELLRKGIKLECDYLWLPFETDGVFIRAVSADASRAICLVFTSAMVVRYRMNRDGSFTIDSD